MSVGRVIMLTLDGRGEAVWLTERCDIRRMRAHVGIASDFLNRAAPGHGHYALPHDETDETSLHCIAFDFASWRINGKSRVCELCGNVELCV
jgi:hypothetical protein